MLRFGILVIIFSSMFASVLAAPPQQASITYQVVEAFYGGRQVYYYTFQNGTPILDEGARVGVGVQYRLVDEDGTPIEGQYDIIAANIFEEGYSDLREIINVTVPDDYKPNSITSADELLAQDWPPTSTGETYNIPLARSGSQLQGRDHDPITLWLDGDDLTAFNFGQNTDLSAPIYVLVEGFDDEGNAIRIDHKVLIKQMHDDEGYSDFWQVNFVLVPADTPPDTYRNVDDINEADFEITPTQNVINCPAIGLDEMAVAYVDDTAYNITHIARPELENAEDMPPVYTYIGEDTPLLMSVIADDDAYTGYCEDMTVSEAEDVYTSEVQLLDDESAQVEPDGSVSTCAYLTPLIE
ncbi:MAG: hypothetical protein L0154_30455 [Chloroflexi bacterium]|nr:hypothetical protein [Chloroflexota bacterium]